jgi:NAD(P)-dependent dehydrogenase (short-subunit alcohol dehydrogenase family)
MNNWNVENMSSQEGRVAIVTGANSGLGYYTAKGLASKGAEVIMACRNVAKAETAVEKMLREIPNAKLKIMELDLSELSSVHRFVQNFAAEYKKLDLLINNAGIMAIPFRKTADGFEMQFGINHLGHFALTGQLIEFLNSTPSSRIVVVSSLAQKAGRIDFDHLNSERKYRKWAAYGRSKFANLLFMLELSDRIRSNDKGMMAVAAHPGYAASNLLEKGPEMNDRKWLIKAGHFANKIAAQSTEMGALPTLYAATSEEVINGGFYGPAGLGGMRGYPTQANPKNTRITKQLKIDLWSHSEELTGVSFLSN